MPIKLVAVDLDGTLLNSRGRIPDLNRAALNSAMGRGVEVALVSGRRWSSAREIAIDLGISNPLVAHNGALVKCPVTNRQLTTWFLSPQAAIQVLQMATRFHQYAILHRNGGLHGQTVVHQASRTNQRMQSYLAQLPESVIHCDSFEAMIDNQLIHVTFGGELHAIRELEHLFIEKGIPENVRLTKTYYEARNLGIIDLLNQDCSKRAAIQFLVRFYGIARSEVLAIGDNHNDLEMLEYAGIGVTVANCVEELKQRGFEEVASNDECGVAEALHRFLS